MADESPELAGKIPQSTAATQAASPLSSTSDGKRKADFESEEVVEQHESKKLKPSDDEAGDNDDQSVTAASEDTNGGQEAQQPSKNQLKRLRRQAAYEAFKAGRKDKRKEKRHEKQAKKRAEKEAKIAEAIAAGIDPATVLQNPEPWKPFPVPLAFVIDCDFEQYMREPEIVSLSSQITRAYSQNRKAKYQAHLWVTSWGGALKTRFETILKNAHLQWRGVRTTSDDFKSANELVKSDMTGEMIDVIKPSEDNRRSLKLEAETISNGVANEEPKPEPELAEDIDQSIVYLTSESPYTLERLEANTTYVIGGIVDRNREKGLCYKRAQQYKVRTAKLPIGEYMAMQSRYVLTTNQVVEIMAKWLECGDWGEAFMDVIPKRKGGVLKNGESAASTPGEDHDDRADAEGGKGQEEAVEEPAAVPSQGDVAMEDTPESKALGPSGRSDACT
ncbi:guanine-1-methyltransferase-domain-containing protein [Rhypophila decipiens]|uniref:tRNA (guanine(9)-N1)-methyltransferase n=1 Tax=Rhypophila decipiens TaxID=261697 RepID=A0AAN6YKK0_9PEZI|nr:guanine-1-methyltransferase-domain-containing protein [Rhypophila decipiens]